MKQKNQYTPDVSGKTGAPWVENVIDQSSYLKIILIVVVFSALGFIIYSNTLESPFVFDDELRILDNPDIRIDELTAQNLWNAAFGDFSTRSRPIGNISFALNYYFHQYKLAGYHLVNVIVHIVSGILLWIFLKKTLNLKPVLVEKIHGKWIALSAALLWLANPVQTQSVTYVVQRYNSMAAMFFLLSFVFYLNGRLAAKKGQKWVWLSGAVLGWFLALGCKQNTAMLPFLIFLYEWYFFRDLSFDWLKQNLKFIIIIVAIFIIISFIYLGSKPVDNLTSIRDFAHKEYTIFERVMTQFRVVIYYLSLIGYPNPSRQNLDYDFPLSYSLFNPATTLPAIIVIAALIVLGIILAKKERLISFCIFWFLGNLVIESSVIPLAIIFEHRLYLPSMLVWLVPVILAWRYIRSEWVIVGLSCVLLALFSYWTFERNMVWRSAVTLWADCVKKSPNKARAYSNLGVVQNRQNMTDEAFQNFLKALQLNPAMDESHFNLAIILEARGQTDEAMAHYRRAVEIKPDFVKAHNNLGVAYMSQDKTKEAGVHLLKSLQLDPNFAQAHNNMGLLLSKQGQINEAIEHFTKALHIDPNIARAQLNLGDALLMQGKTEQAINRYQKALQLDPDYAEAHNNLGGQLLSQGKLDEALEHLNRALSIKPELAQAHNNVGIILIHQGNLDAAITHFQDAVRLKSDFSLAENNLKRALAIKNNVGRETDNNQDAVNNKPNDPQSHYEMGNFYLNKRKLTMAIVEYKKALSLKPRFIGAQNNLAMAYAANRQYDQALAAFKQLIQLDPDNAGIYYNIAALHALQNNVPDSIAWLKQAIDKGYRNWDLIKTDQDLANIRHSQDYKLLVEGH
jgi:tetratricopeptide (TPR) repeat protein